MPDDKPEMVSLYQPLDQPGLSPGSRFTFHCHAALPCFNQCCRTPTVILSPYDLLRLSRALGITTGEFLLRYTRQEIEPLALLPLIFLDIARSPAGGCPLLGEQGCTVYAHRPAACRLFPVTMGSRLTEHGVEDYYFCRPLDYCRGFDTEVEWTLESWQASQGFLEYDRERRAWLEILLKAASQEPGGIDAVRQDLFAALAYDLDKFRRLIFDPVFLKAYGLEVEALQDVKTDDLALLRFSYRFLPEVLSEAGAQKLTAVLRRSTKFFEID